MAMALSRARSLVAILLFTVCILAAVSCSPASFAPPAASSIEGAPIEVTTLEIWNDYKADPIAAAAKYEGKSLHFSSVRVDQMSFLGEGIDPELYVQEGIDPRIYVVKFHTWSLADIINIRETYIVDIVGHDIGFKNGYVNVRIDWIKCIDPLDGDPNPPPEY